MAAPAPHTSGEPAQYLPSGPVPRVAILLSTHNGEAFLLAQLDSFLAQQSVDWRLYWRDDGSSDGSVAVMEAFAASLAGGDGPRCIRVDLDGHVHVTGSYMALLRAAVAGGAGTVAFADQDDVWLPGKLARGLAQIGQGEEPVLYCSRQVLVDAALRRLGDSVPVEVPPGLGPALTQNVATGCTVMMNRAAAVLVAGSEPSPRSLHDWWSYLVVAAAGGRIIADRDTTVLYRQHGGNLVGAPLSSRQRALAALRRGPGSFMKVFRAQVMALEAQPHLLSPTAKPMIEALAASLSGGLWQRLMVLRRYPLLRQTWAETWLFRCWFLLG